MAPGTRFHRSEVQRALSQAGFLREKTVWGKIPSSLFCRYSSAGNGYCWIGRPARMFNTPLARMPASCRQSIDPVAWVGTSGLAVLPAGGTHFLLLMPAAEKKSRRAEWHRAVERAKRPEVP